jgi:hypothetical protein
MPLSPISQPQTTNTDIFLDPFTGVEGAVEEMIPNTARRVRAAFENALPPVEPMDVDE